MLKSVFKRKRTAALLVALTLLIACFATVTPQKKVYADSTVVGLQQQIESAKNEQAELQKQLEDAKAKQYSALQTKSYYDNLVSAKQNEIILTEQLIEDLGTNITALQDRIAELNEDINRKFEELRENIKATYQDERITYLEMVLKSDSFKDFLSNLDRAAVMLDYRNNLVKAINEELTEVKQSKADMEQNREEQKALKVTLEEAKAELEVSQKEATAYYIEATASEEAYENLLAENEAALADLEASLNARLAEIRAAELARQQQNGGNTYQPDGYIDPSTSANSDFRWPLDPAWSMISCPFGGGHRGIDIPASMGSNVYASQAGVVVTSEYHYSWGNYVLINHGNGIFTLYAHNSALCVTVGESVAKGQVIAKIGSTGNSTGPHCHYEVWVGYNASSYVNPMAFVSPGSI